MILSSACKAPPGSPWRLPQSTADDTADHRVSSDRGRPTMTGAPQGHCPPPERRSEGWGPHSAGIRGSREPRTLASPTATHGSKGELQGTGLAVPKTDESP